MLGADETMNGQKRRTTKRSRKGCRECRRRKIKCDEKKPHCSHCQKIGISCPVDSVFRFHHYTAEINEPTSSQQSHLSPTFGGREARANNDSENLPMDASPTANLLPGPQYGEPNLAFDQHAPSTGLADQRSPAGVSSHLRGGDVAAAIPHVPEWSPSSLPSITSNPMNEDLSLSGADNLNESKEVALLIRRYADCSGPRMDLFGHDSYFSRHGVILTRDSLLVKYAMCASAAKQLGHMRYPDSQLRSDAGSILRRSQSRSNRIDYLWYGAKFYEKAIQCMAADLSLDWELILAPSPAEMPWAAPVPPGSRLSPRFTEARLLAACIMCHYEELSASGRAWSRHLNGIYKLLRLEQEQSTSLNGFQPQPPSPAFQPEQSFLSVFWYFVQNDFEESFISMKATRVNTQAILLWQSVGLPLTHDGRLTPECFSWSASGGGCDFELLALHSLLRLLCAINNYIFPTSRTAQRQARSDTENVQDQGVEWRRISGELEEWATNLPSSFKPDAYYDRHIAEDAPTSTLFVNESWFTSNTCAITIAYYHMAKMLLLIHAPSIIVVEDTQRPNDWLRSSRKLYSSLCNYAKEVIAIALGNPGEAVRAHMVQPLYVAGRCLSLKADQIALMGLLKDIESELGVATGYRVKALVEEWGQGFLSHGPSELDAELSDLSSKDE